MYDNLMNKYKYGGLQNPNIYLDETNLGMCRTHRRLFVILASQVVKEGKNEKALEVLDRSLEVIPTYNVPHDFILCSSKEMADDYIKIGHQEKALPILNELANKAVEYITWYESLDDQRFYDNYESCYRQLLMLDDVNKSLSEIALKEGDKKEGIGTRTAVHYAQTFNSLYEAFKQRIDDNK
jgi:tetratricopeptide (TPR) repeat protein